MEPTASNASPRQALLQIPMLRELGEAAIEQLTAIGDLLSIKKGTLLFSEGEQRECIYFVCSGSVKLEMTTARCGRQTVLTLGNGDLLAWSALLGDSVMTATAIAAEESVLVAFSAEELRKRFELDHDFGYQMMLLVANSLSRRLLATRLQLLDLFHA